MKALAMGLAGLLLATPAVAHDARMDKCGCHSQYGLRHCHAQKKQRRCQAPVKGAQQPPPTRPLVVKV